MSYQYLIEIEGELENRWAGQIQFMDISCLTSPHFGRVTRIEGEIKDQAALRGLLNGLWDLNMNIINLKRLHPEEG